MKKLLSITLCVLLLTLAGLSSVSVSATDKDYIYRDRNYIFEVINDCEITIHHYIGTNDTVIVPATIGGLPVKSIEKWAFFGTDVKEVTVSEGITTIGEETFYNCQSLETVVLPSTLESTEKAIFRFCRNLKNVTFSGTESDPVLGKYLLYACDSLESVNIPSNVTKIPEGMFAYCQSLDNVVLPDGTQKIYDNAFYGSGLSNITLPKPVYYIGNMAFADCTTLDEINNLRENCDIVSENAFAGSPADNPYEETEKITIYFENTLDWRDITISYYAINYSETYGWCEIDMTYSGTNSNGKDIYRADIPISQTIYFNGIYERGMISSSMTQTITDNDLYYLYNGLNVDSYPYTLPDSTEDEATALSKTNLQPVGASSVDEFSGQITEDGFLIGATFPEVVEREKDIAVEVGAQADNMRASNEESANNVRDRGDCNYNGKIEVRDATLIQKYEADLIPINDPQFEYKNADADANGIVNIRDAVYIQKHIAGIITIPTDPVQSA